MPYTTLFRSRDTDGDQSWDLGAGRYLRDMHPANLPSGRDGARSGPGSSRDLAGHPLTCGISWVEAHAPTQGVRSIVPGTVRPTGTTTRASVAVTQSGRQVGSGETFTMDGALSETGINATYVVDFGSGDPAAGVVTVTKS